MLPLFTKPLHDLKADDVQQLIDERVPEGQLVEFKEMLPGEPWPEKTKKLGNEARDKILTEVVAFANADGGNVVIGIQESEDHPKRATKLTPLPKCHDLAARLTHAARDCIEPQLPSIEVFGIELRKRPKGAGAVLVRVPPSRLAAHRLMTTRECYIRRADRSEKMTMREIQDLTLRRASTFEALEARLEDRKDRVKSAMNRGNERGKEILGIRFSVVPTTGPINIERVYDQDTLFPDIRVFAARVEGKDTRLDPPGRVGSINHMPPRPILRGARRVSEGDDKMSLIHEVHSDGLVELFFSFESGQGGNHVFMEWTLGLLANVLVIADATRQVAGMPAVEMALDVEIGSSVTTPVYCDLSVRRFLGVGDIESGPLDPNPLRLPPYTVTDVGNFSRIVKQVMNDLREAAGFRAIDDFEVKFE